MRYQKRISGPLLDRIDIHVEVPRVDYEKLADKRNAENSETIRKRVQAAREQQLERLKGTKLTCNAEMGPSEVRDFCNVEPSAEKLLKAAMQHLGMLIEDVCLMENHSKHQPSMREGWCLERGNLPGGCPDTKFVVIKVGELG